MHAKVSIIISAYGLIGTLKTTLQSIYQQTVSDWQVLLIADCCSDEFFEQLGDLDSRVTVINLPVNCGHQYGPNSIGIRLADSEYIAFMNHDDLWTADHLELALAKLENEEKDAYFGRAAFCHPPNQPGWPNGDEPLRFSEYNRPQNYWRSLFGPFYFFEPASAWVVRTCVAKQVGDWRSPVEVDVSPVMDWFARCLAATDRVFFSEAVTTLKINLRNDLPSNKGVPLYYRETVGSTKLQELIDFQPSTLRELIHKQVNQAAQLGLKVRDEMSGELLIDRPEQQRIRAFVRYKFFGEYQREDIGATIGPYTKQLALDAQIRRTGNENPQFPSVTDVYRRYLNGR